MQELEQKIMDLSGRWCKYVGLDHCKDRDFHWYITKTYSYGEPPKYIASHNGYRADDWSSQEVDNEEDAMYLLIDKLERTIKGQIKLILKEMEYVKAEPEFAWHGMDELQKELDALEGK